MAKRAKKRGERAPSYRLHKASGNGIVTLSGKDHYCGPHGTAASEKRYRELLSQWYANDKRPLPSPKGKAADEDDDTLTVDELAEAYSKWSDSHYVREGVPTGEPAKIRLALRTVKEMFGSMEANDFGPNCLRSVMDRYVAAGMVRTTVNTFADRVRRCFKWGVSRELVKPEVIVGLSAVDGLRKGRSAAKESTPTMSMPDDVMETLLDDLSPVYRALVVVQRWSGARAGELLQATPAMIDRSGPVWFLTPARHKGEHRGKARTIALGPKCQEALAPFLKRTAANDLIFKNRDGKTVRPAIYATAIRNASKRLGIDYYRPHTLRHAFASHVRKTFDLESAQVLLGHARADVTQIYAERDLSKAAAVAAEIG